MFSPPSEHLSRRFSLEEILSATNNFDDSLIIGKGGFGNVYKGNIIDNNGNGASSSSTTVAIKRLNPLSKQGASEFWTEITMLSRFRHSHLVSLIGYCDNCNEMILVYEYMVHGTLADHVHNINRKNDEGNNSSLSWVQRLKICIGAARGLDYLHTGTAILQRVIHLDVKSSNILLDENWAAKISDFGLSRIGPAEQEVTDVSTLHIQGTLGYMDPDYFLTHRFTRKSDVYAFGVVLLEVLCERPALDQSLNEDQWGLAGWGQECINEGASHKIIGPNLKWEILPNSLMEFVQIADQCLHSRPKQRPTMSEVVAKLELALAFQLRTDLVIEEYSFKTCLPINNQENPVSYREDDHIDKVLQQGNADSKQFSTVGAPVVLGFVLDYNVMGQRSTMNLAKEAYPDKMVGSTLTPANLLLAILVLHSGSLPGNHLTSLCVDSAAAKDPEVHRVQRKWFPLRELQVATDNFSNRNILGRGGFGKVYKGRLDDGTLVAVKRLKEERTPGGQLQFQTEVELLSKTVHRNLCRLIGFCTTPTERVLVYPYMANGSVASSLRERPETQPPLDWPTRKQIALGSARGIMYLHDHCDPKIIHRDIKAANILLDEEFEAVVGDFGLAKLMDYKDSQVTTAVRGTIGHIPPEYLSTGKTSEKSDVFGYGVMLLELITGQRAFDLARLANDDDVMLLDWVKGLMKEKKLEALVDADLNGNYNDNEVEQLIQVALLCTRRSLTDRPKMSEVVRMLEGNGLAKSWEELQNDLVFQQEINSLYPNADWIIADSTSYLQPDELSGPR
ncbi:hypothetical protein LguiA_001630 [Lonicera macranthoides]